MLAVLSEIWVGKDKEHLKLGGTSGRGMKEELELTEAHFMYEQNSQITKNK